MKFKAVWTQRKDVIMFGVISMLYSLGGGGWKPLRRYVMPMAIIATLLPFKKTWQNILAALLLALPLHYGYTEIVDGLNWPAMAALGAVMGLSWAPVARSLVWATMATLCLAFCLSVALNKYFGLDWMWAEYIVGVGYGMCYLMMEKRNDMGMQVRSV